MFQRELSSGSYNWESERYLLLYSNEKKLLYSTKK